MTKTSRKTSRKPHAKTTKDPRFNVSPWFSCSETGIASSVSLRCHPQQFALPLTRIVDFVDFLVRSPYPKPFKQSRYSGSFCFFNAHPLIQESLIRGFALKKPLTYVRGFVELSLQLSNKILEDLIRFHDTITQITYWYWTISQCPLN